MDCPQCGSTLETYVLDGQEASVCADCGFVGIAAEHRGEARRIESWEDALRRFYRAQGTDTDPGVEVRPPLSRPGDESTDESWEEALQRFHAKRTARAADGDPAAVKDDAAPDENVDTADGVADAEADGDGADDGDDGDGADGDEADADDVVEGDTSNDAANGDTSNDADDSDADDVDGDDAENAGEDAEGEAIERGDGTGTATGPAGEGDDGSDGDDRPTSRPRSQSSAGDS